MFLTRQASHCGRPLDGKRRQRPIVVMAVLMLPAVCSFVCAAADPWDHCAQEPQGLPDETSAFAPESAWQENRGEDELVFIHGLGASAALWKDLTPYLAGTYRIFLYELQGHGQAGPLKNTASASLANVVAAFGRWLVEHDLVYPNLVGHGLGGLIAMQYALDHPQSVRSLTVIDTEARPLLDEQQKVSIARSLIQNYDRYIASRFIGISEIERINEQAVDMALRTESASLAGLLLSSFDWDLTDLMPNLDAPLLLIGSEAFLPDESTERECIEFYGYGSVQRMAFKRIHGSGHYLMLENPNQLARIILGWLGNQDR